MMQKHVVNCKVAVAIIIIPGPRTSAEARGHAGCTVQGGPTLPAWSPAPLVLDFLLHSPQTLAASASPLPDWGAMGTSNYCILLGVRRSHV